MKKLLLVALLTITATLGMAQNNPKSGYIMTNNGDIIQGIIDFRSNEKLSKQCVFQANGESESKTYQPGEIEGYKFDDGKYFVSRRLNVTGNSELYFAEFIVQGKMNLYCIAYNGDEYYFFEREDGEMAKLTKRSTFKSNSDEILREKQEQYGKVVTLLKASNKASLEMNDANLTKDKLIKIVNDYHKDVCTDGSSCKVYEYKNKYDEIDFHFKAFAGFAYYLQNKYSMSQVPGQNYSGCTYELGIGAELSMERAWKGLSLEAELAITPKYSSDRDVKGDVIIYYGSLIDPSKLKVAHSKCQCCISTLAIGVVKRFGSGKVQPLVRAGGFAAMYFGAKELMYDNNNTVAQYTWTVNSHLGLYVGAGIQMGTKKFVRLHTDIYKSFDTSEYANMMKWGLTAEFIL